ncbi:hypothetical protein [Virgibacillus salexigens]|uniref:hypothetical protein n=1 Tax=Virgibacillus salexigens TaxID=61016 RepID=UPI003081CA1C
MKQLKGTAQRFQELVEFAESEGWSEEELARVINLLHSELKDYSLSAFPSSSDKEINLGVANHDNYGAFVKQLNRT